MSAFDSNGSFPILQSIPFHGDAIQAIQRPDGTIHVAPRPICQNLGVMWAAQYQKLKADSFWGVSIIDIPSEGGVQKTCVIPLTRVAAWLFTISPNKVAPDLAPRIRLYRAECADVLDRHFRKVDPGRTLDEFAVLRAMIDSLENQKKILQEHEARLRAVEVEIDKETGYQSLLAWCKLNNRDFPPGQTSAWSRRLGQYCTEKNIAWTKAPDPTYGNKSIFPIWVISETFDELGPRMEK